MDPLTQGALGAALPQSVADRKRLGIAMLCGFAGGMAPDLDVLIRSSEDPLLFLEYHRQFTHSLIFIPIGGLLVAAALWLVVGRKRQWPFRDLLLFSTLGYATHALLDACTTYGTQLLWPFTDARFAWNNVSIIDPLLTLPLVSLMIASRWRRSPGLARLGVCWVVIYLLLGVFARDMAETAGAALAASRGHHSAVVSAKPSFANLLVWKTIYRADGRFYIDAIRIGTEPKTYVGESVPTLNLQRDLPWLRPDSKHALDIERFRWFSMDHLALDPEDPLRVIDVRYSMLPNEIRPLWGIALEPAGQDQHVRYVTTRDGADKSLSALWQMMLGERSNSTHIALENDQASSSAVKTSTSAAHP